jgi:hypothetical protein
MSWNTTQHTLDIYPGITDSVLQVGQEEWVLVKNISGVGIANNMVVRVSGVSAGQLTIALVDASAGGKLGYTIGITTDVIANNSYGFVTVRGTVHGYNTSGFVAGDILYVSPSSLGALTNIQPTPPDFTFAVAVAMDSLVDGLIYVRFGSPDATIKSTAASVASKDPTGFNFNDSIAVTYDSTARTITLVGNSQYSWRGKVTALTSPWTSAAHPATLDKKYFLYSVDGVNFAWSETPWQFSDLMIAFVNYGTTDKFAIREPHGLMNWQSHEVFHTVVGTYRKSGGTLSNYVLNSTTAADRRPYVSATVVKDEDILTTNALHNSTLYTKSYLTTTGVSTFTIETAEIIAVSGSQPYYNQFTGGNWVQTLMSNNSYMSIWLVAVPTTNDTESQKYRYFWVQGQTNGSLATESALTPQSLNQGTLGVLFTEFVFLAKVVIQYTAGNWKIDSVTDLLGTKATTTSSPSGVYLSVVTTDSTLTGTGTPTSALGVSVLGVYADNTTALAGGLVAGNIYRTTTGGLMIVY